jgi:hypothetical protein
MAHIDAAFVEQVLHVPERQWEPDIEHHRQADDLGAGLEPLEGAELGHAETLPSPLTHFKPGLPDRTRAFYELITMG